MQGSLEKEEHGARTMNNGHGHVDIDGLLAELLAIAAIMCGII